MRNIFDIVVILYLCYCVNGHLIKDNHELDDVNENTVVKSCQKKSACSCKSPKLGLIDLSPLAKSDGNPMFLNVESGIQQYSWNPCNPFTQDECIDVAVCQRLTFPSSASYTLGDQGSANFIVNKKGVQLTYYANTLTHSNVSATFMRNAYVKLVCDLSQNPGTFVADGEDRDRPGRYYFTLTSYHACPERLKPFPKSHSLSAGTCLLIVCAVGIMLYLSVGIALQMFAFKKTGTDVIPNKSLWVALPGLVKEGGTFILRRGKTPGYSEI